MQHKTKLIFLTVLTFIFSLFSAFSLFSFSQSVDESVYESCSACTLTPDQLVRYIRFVGAILDGLSSTSKVDYTKVTAGSTAQGDTNTLVDYVKQENDSYFGVFKREGRTVLGEIQGASMDTKQAVLRDGIGDFVRQSVAGIRADALSRDISKLEQLDERIDREAVVHMTNFVFGDPIPANQIAKLKDIFGAYNDILIIENASYINSSLQTGISYKDLIGWLNVIQRSMKNHITYSPKKDFKRESSKGVHYILNPTWSANLAASYECVRALGGLNCNQTYGKTASLGKEFGQGVTQKVKTTVKKFESSIAKLKQLGQKSNYLPTSSNIFIDGNEIDNDDINAIGQGLSSAGKNTLQGAKNSINAIQNKVDILQYNKESRQAVYDECKKKISENPDQCERNTVIDTYGSTSFLSSWGQKFAGKRGRGCHCTQDSDYLHPTIKNITKAEEAKILAMTQRMNGFIDGILASNDEYAMLGELSAPHTVTSSFPALSMSVYKTKDIVGDLIDASIESCLAFCKNLNGKVNCGSK